MDFKTPLFQLVELKIVAGIAGSLQPVYFQQQPQLQSMTGNQKVYVRAIETYTSGMLKGSPLTAGNAVAAPADIENAVLVLNSAGRLNFNQIPLVDLVRVQTDTGGSYVPFSRSLFMFKDLWEVDWTKSYVQLIVTPGSSGTTEAPFSYIFGVHYEYGEVYTGQ